MEKMQQSDVETKWGLVSDPALKDQVKITILATGFGIEDIDSDALEHRLLQRDQEAQARAAEKAEQDAERAQRRGQYYGPDSSRGAIRRPIYSYMFNDEELDDEDVISMVETSPTYKRTKENLKQIKEVANKNVASDAGAVITFS